MMNLLPLAPERASRLVSSFSRAQVLVIGDAMLDTFLIGRVTRISPEAPVAVVAFERQTHRIAVARGRPAVHVFRAELRRELGRFDEATADLDSAIKWSGAPLAQYLQVFLKSAGVDTGTAAGALQEAIARCIRATPCGADLLRWARWAPTPTCAAPDLC